MATETQSITYEEILQQLRERFKLGELLSITEFFMAGVRFAPNEPWTDKHQAAWDKAEVGWVDAIVSITRDKK